MSKEPELTKDQLDDLAVTHLGRYAKTEKERGDERLEKAKQRFFKAYEPYGGERYG